MKQLFFLLLVFIFSSFIQKQEDVINTLFAQKKYQACANLIQENIINNDYVHYNFTYKLASCYSYLNKNDSAYYYLKNIVNYFNSLDGLVSITNIPIDYTSFKNLTNTHYWKKINQKIKQKAIKDNFQNKDFSFFYDIQISHNFLSNKLNYYKNENDTVEIRKVQMAFQLSDEKSIQKVCRYLDKHIKKNIEIKDNWITINLMIHQSKNLEIKEKYLAYFYENAKKKNLNASAYAMFYMKYLEQKNMLKNRNYNVVKDSLIESFNK